MYSKEEKREYFRKYREEHRDELNAYRRNRYSSEPDYKAKKAVECKAWYEKHKNDPEFIAKRKAYHDKWLNENRDKWNTYNRERRRALKGGAE